MNRKRNQKLIIKVILIGVFIAVLSYLFHPGVGQLTLTINGRDVADPLMRIAALPTFLAIIGMTALLTVMLLFGAGIIIFLVTLSAALIATFIIAPYFWPMLMIIFLIIALTFLSTGSNKPDRR